ncbi:MAG: stage II sporulation protein M, partial [Firmicutes bacterium]|nr:stage II sporulation protein M [Bacillota bacterium]
MFVAGALGELILNYFKRHLTLYLALILLFAAGLGLGALSTQKLSAVQKVDLAGYLANIYDSINSAAASPFQKGEVFYQNMLDNIVKTTGLMFVLGLTVVGAPLIFGIVFLRGFVLGFTVGFLVQDAALKGLILSTASILPHNLLVVPAVLVGAASALCFASTALKTLLGMSKERIYGQFASTTFLSLCSCLLLILGTLVET